MVYTSYDRAFDAVDRIRELASNAETAMTAMAVAWVLANPAVTSAIVGASRAEQLADSLAAADSPVASSLKAEPYVATVEGRMGDATR